jgi:choline/glycine/proline betaine transport protein
VKNISRIKPAFVYDEKNEEDRSEDELYYCAIVHLIEGGQDYDIMGWSKDGIRNDVVDQYEKHMHYMHLIN